MSLLKFTRRRGQYQWEVISTIKSKSQFGHIGHIHITELTRNPLFMPALRINLGIEELVEITEFLYKLEKEYHVT